jgi:hypothetical protein
VSQLHWPSPLTVPWLLQDAALLNWQLGPLNPASQVQPPEPLAVPWPLQVPALLNWQLLPA